MATGPNRERTELRQAEARMGRGGSSLNGGRNAGPVKSHGDGECRASQGDDRAKPQSLQDGDGRVPRHARRLPANAAALIMMLFLITGCAAKGTDGETGGANAEALRQQLAQSATAADKPANWSIEMKLGQKLDENGQVSAMDMTTTGPVERTPLRMKQSIQSKSEGETSKMETILTPDGYYMHDLATGDWMRMTESAIPDVKATLSDYQTDPSEPINRLATSADKLHASTQADGSLVYDYDGDGTDPGAKAIIDDILRGTFGGEAITQEITESIQVKAFVYKLAVDAASKLPKTVNLSMALSLEFEPGQRLILNQTLDIAYSGWDSSLPVTVPEEAKNAEEIMPPTQELIDELERLQGEQASSS